MNLKISFGTSKLESMRKEESPLVTVVMTTYNREKYVAESINSILNQTYKNIEFIIIDDASSDNIVDYIKGINDLRLKLIVNRENEGPSYSSNVGLSLAKGKYIARMDSDDISHPKRIGYQVKFMEKNPDYALVGSWTELIDDEGNTLRYWRYYLESNEIKAHQIFNPSLTHPSIMIRKSVLDKYEIRYNINIRSAIDYELYSQFPIEAKFYNIDQMLIKYRMHSNQITSNAYTEQQKNADMVRQSYLKEIGIVPTDFESRLHSQMSRGTIDANVYKLVDILKWIQKIKDENDKSEYFNKRSLDIVLAGKWLNICMEFFIDGSKTWELFYQFEPTELLDLAENKIDVMKMLESIGLKRKIGIFAAGRLDFYLKELFEKNGHKVICFIDNDLDKQGKLIDGIPIISVAKLSEIECDFIITSIEGLHDQKIGENLRNMIDVEVKNWKDFISDT